MSKTMEELHRIREEIWKMPKEEREKLYKEVKEKYKNLIVEETK